MVTTDYSTRKIVEKINENQLKPIKAFVQGAVYYHCNISDRGTRFAARDLFGGENCYWNDTPLHALYVWHEENGADDPESMAGKDLGWILLDVLVQDKRHFSKIKEYTNVYEWQCLEGEDNI